MIFVSMLEQNINCNLMYFIYLCERNLVFTWKVNENDTLNTEAQLAVNEPFILNL